MPIIAEDLFPPLMGIIRSFPQLTLNTVSDISRAVIEAGAMTPHIRAGPDAVGAGIRYVGGLQFCLFGASGHVVQRGQPQRIGDMERSAFISQGEYINMTPGEGWLNRIVAGARIGMHSDCDIAQRLAAIRIRGLSADVVATLRHRSGRGGARAWRMDRADVADG